MSKIRRDVRCPKCYTRFRSTTGKATRFACPVCADAANHRSLSPGQRILYLIGGLAPALLTPLILAFDAAPIRRGFSDELAGGIFVTALVVGFPALLFAWSVRLQRHSPADYPLLASVLLTPLIGSSSVSPGEHEA